MDTTLGCVFADTYGSGRLTKTLGSVATRKLAGHPVIDWAIRRATESQRLDDVVVIGSSDSDMSSAIPGNIKVVQSEQPDRLGRLAETLRTYPADAVLCIPAASPFLDPTLVDRLIRSAWENDADYASFCSRSNRSMMHAELGFVADWCRTEAIRQLDRQLTDPDQRNTFTNHLVARPEKYSITLLPLPPEIDRDDLRLTLRSGTDWAKAEQIAEVLGLDKVDWKEIAELFEKETHIL